MIWYRVQIGAYAIKKSAEKVSVDLIEKGFKTSITKEGMLYKVRIGSFQDKKKAEKLLARVKKYKKYENRRFLSGMTVKIFRLSMSESLFRIFLMLLMTGNTMITVLRSTL